MTLLTQIVIIFNGLIHFGFAVGEIFFTTCLLEELFGFSPEDAIKTAPIAKNAGIYNSLYCRRTLLVSFCQGKCF